MSFSQSEQLQKKYENEFSKFLIQRINHAGGSLHFQHISGILHQVKFEIKDAFGITKCNLMKFLKSHPNTYKINSKGTVTIVNTTPIDNSDSVEDEDDNANVKKTFMPEIKGHGRILKMFPEFAIIETERPANTYIFSTPTNYGASKDTLFIDMDIKQRSKVQFHAVHGHTDYEIAYRATKVLIYDSDTEKFVSPYIKKCKMNKVSEEENVTKTGQQEIKVIKKKKKDLDDEPSSFETNINPSDKCNSMKGVIEDQYGKIFPSLDGSKGTVIKFGKGFSELVDADSCDFFLYGSKLLRYYIAFEFTEGDDVRFDAIKTKNLSKWKAILVWRGDKPAYTSNAKNMLDEMSDSAENMLCRLSDSSSEISTASLGTKKSKHAFNKEQKTKNKTNVKNNLSTSVKLDESEESKKNILKTSETISKRCTSKEPKCRKKYNMCDQKKLCVNKYKISKRKSLADLPTKNCDNLLSSTESMQEIYLSESCDNSSEENNELQNETRTFRKFLKEDKCEFSILPGNKTNSDSGKIISKNDKTVMKRKANIKTFEDIPGQVTEICCKFAIVKNSSLQRDVDFNLNNFYLNGKSVEEQHISDLKEVIKIGDIIKFNCFEIIDDEGNLYQSVTIAWKGAKPEVYETKPDEFIDDLGLSVSIDNDINCTSETENSSIDITGNTNFDKASKFYPEADSFSENVGKVISKNNKTVMKGKANIKSFENILGQVTKVCCKFAIVKNSSLQRDVDFNLNNFYLNGKSVEEQHISDLKEVIKIGDIIKFNCFEVIDDEGNLYQSVPIAWKGAKPEVYETKPDEFIDDLGLSVSIDNDKNCTSETENSSIDITGNTNFDKASKFYPEADSFSENVGKVISKNNKTVMKGKANIKSFENILGQVTKVCCKFAVVKNSSLQRDVDFNLNNFYLNGKSMEEQHISDLKEVIKIGDIIKFNCFEVIDDEGYLYQSVPIAWKGAKPEVYETKPDEFIDDLGLSVSIDNDINCTNETENSSIDITGNTNFDKASKFYSETDSFSENISNDDSSYKSSMNSINEVRENYKDSSSDAPYKVVSKKIIQKLEAHGFILSSSEIEQSIASELINLVQNFKDEEINSTSKNQNISASTSKMLCSYCANGDEKFARKVIRTKHTEVQTIITGEIASTKKRKV